MVDYDEYRNRCGELAQRFEAGDFAGAEAGWRELLGAQELADLDRAMMMHNLAHTLAAAGRHEEAEAVFDQGISWERTFQRGAVRAGKANWLTGLGRTQEAAAVLEELAAEPWATWGERRDHLERAAQLRAPQAGQTGHR